MAKTQVVGTCKLCLKTSELRESHIIPKFIWRDSGLTGSGKKFSVTCITDTAFDEKNRQDGFKEHLLCADCENIFSVWEGYMKKRLNGVFEKKDSRPKGHFVWAGWDYEKTKLFQMSLLWRMGVSSLPMYGLVRLGKHEEILRQLLLAGRPTEPWRYPCASVLLTHNGHPITDLFHQPEPRLHGKRMVYRTVIAGMLWFFLVSSHRSNLFPAPTVLTRQGDWVMYSADMREFEFLRTQIELLKKLS